MSKPLDIDAFKPGSTISLKVVSQPRVEDHVQTIERLMRQDPAMKKGLNKGHDIRMGRLVVRSRGGRPWEKRERSAKVVRCEAGAMWSMTWVPHLAGDLRSVAKYLAKA